MPYATTRPRSRAALGAPALATSLALLAGCSGVQADPDARPEPRAEQRSTQSPEHAGSSGGHESHEDHESHEHAHSSSTELSALLVHAGALPDGYVAGGHHHAPPAGAAPRLQDDCRPLAELIGTHPAVLGEDHPRAGRSFTKSHFGPTLAQTVIDYGEPELAAAAVERLGAAAEGCERYVQSTSPIGAGTYTVRPGPEVAGRPGGEAVRLRAVGADFAGISWDVWWMQYGARVVSVHLRSAPGGDTDELADGVRAAVAAMDAADS